MRNAESLVGALLVALFAAIGGTATAQLPGKSGRQPEKEARVRIVVLHRGTSLASTEVTLRTGPGALARFLRVPVEGESRGYVLFRLTREADELLVSVFHAREVDFGPKSLYLRVLSRLFTKLDPLFELVSRSKVVPEATVRVPLAADLEVVLRFGEIVDLRPRRLDKMRILQRLFGPGDFPELRPLRPLSLKARSSSTPARFC